VNKHPILKAGVSVAVKRLLGVGGSHQAGKAWAEVEKKGG